MLLIRIESKLIRNLPGGITFKVLSQFWSQVFSFVRNCLSSNYCLCFFIRLICYFWVFCNCLNTTVKVMRPRQARHVTVGFGGAFCLHPLPRHPPAYPSIAICFSFSGIGNPRNCYIYLFSRILWPKLHTYLPIYYSEYCQFNLKR